MIYVEENSEYLKRLKKFNDLINFKYIKSFFKISSQFIKCDRSLLFIIFFQPSLTLSKAYINQKSSFMEQFFGNSMYRYTYDLQTGTSHYRRKDGKIDSWRSPEKRGNKIFLHSSTNFIKLFLAFLCLIAFSLGCDWIRNQIFASYVKMSFK